MNIDLAPFLNRYIPDIRPDAPRALKDKRSQIEQFLEWLALNPIDFDARLLARYTEYLRQERKYKPASVRAHLASLRAWLRSLLRDPAFQRAVAAFLPVSEAERTRLSEQLMKQFWDMIDPSTVRVERGSSQADAGFCPTVTQMQALVDYLRVRTLPDVRDVSVILMLALLGLRPGELSALDVTDFKPSEWKLIIPDKPGCTARDIPLNEVAIVKELLERWVEDTGLTEGPLLRGFYRGNSLRPERLGLHSIERILAAYPIAIDGAEHVLKPLELRRFAARLLAREDYPLEAMCKRLGVSQVQTIIDYLGGQLPNHLASEPPLQFKTLMQKVYNR